VGEKGLGWMKTVQKKFPGWHAAGPGDILLTLHLLQQEHSTSGSPRTACFAVQLWGGSGVPCRALRTHTPHRISGSSSPRLVYFLHILRSLMGTRCLALGPALVYK